MAPIDRDDKHWCDPASEQPGSDGTWTCPGCGTVWTFLPDQRLWLQQADLGAYLSSQPQPLAPPPSGAAAIATGSAPDPDPEPAPDPEPTDSKPGPVPGDTHKRTDPPRKQGKN